MGSAQEVEPAGRIRIPMSDNGIVLRHRGLKIGEKINVPYVIKKVSDIQPRAVNLHNSATTITLHLLAAT